MVAAAGKWWLYEQCGQQQRGQHFGAMAVGRICAAVLASAAALCVDKARTRFFALGGCEPTLFTSADQFVAQWLVRAISVDFRDAWRL